MREGLRIFLGMVLAPGDDDADPVVLVEEGEADEVAGFVGEGVGDVGEGSDVVVHVSLCGICGGG